MGFEQLIKDANAFAAGLGKVFNEMVKLTKSISERRLYAQKSFVVGDAVNTAPITVEFYEGDTKIQTSLFIRVSQNTGSSSALDIQSSDFVQLGQLFATNGSTLTFRFRLDYTSLFQANAQGATLIIYCVEKNDTKIFQTGSTAIDYFKIV